MNLLFFVSFAALFFTCVYSNAIPAEGDDEDLCPPTENIAPCTCFKAPISKRITALCSNFTDAHDIQAIFDRNPRWNLQDVWIDNSVMSYLPANMLEQARFQNLKLTSTTLVTLFDRKPKTTPELKVHMIDVKILRGFSWRLIDNINLLEVAAINMKIKSFGQEFKDSVPKGVQRIWFENTGVSSIKNNAFSVLTKLEVLVLKGGNLKKVSRDMFPLPWDVTYLDLSNQKIAALPERFFSGMPKLGYFVFEGNMLSTLSERVFDRPMTFYLLEGNPINCNCNIKWIVEKLQTTFLKGECYEPKSFQGTKLGDLTARNFGYCQ